MAPRLFATLFTLLLVAATDEPGPPAEFQFLRMEYRDHPSIRRPFRRNFEGRGSGWWEQDWPEADAHFTQGIRRLTRIDTGNGMHLPLTDDRLYDYPWIYATQAAYWDIGKPEMDRLRQYLRRGGFLVVDDFHGPADWETFRHSMLELFPDYPIVDIELGDAVMKVAYSIEERTTIPGLRHLRRGPTGQVVVQPQAVPPIWRAIYDERGRMLVAINFNMDVGDAWEHADLPEYPAEMTMLAYRLGINYIIYAMTH